MHANVEFFDSFLVSVILIESINQPKIDSWILISS